jgi:hypothetical protein
LASGKSVKFVIRIPLVGRKDNAALQNLLHPSDTERRSQGASARAMLPCSIKLPYGER